MYYYNGRTLYDGDQCSVKACWTKEANRDAERYINSVGYILNVQGKCMRDMTKDFLLTQYLLTHVENPSVLSKDCNKDKPKYTI